MGYAIVGAVCFAAGCAFMHYLPAITAWSKSKISAEVTKVETDVKDKL